MKYFGETVTSMMMDVARRYVRAIYSQFARTLVPSRRWARCSGTGACITW